MREINFLISPYFPFENPTYKKYSLCDEVVEDLSPAGRSVETWRRITYDLEERASWVDVLKGRLGVGKLDGGDA